MKNTFILGGEGQNEIKATTLIKIYDVLLFRI